MRITTTHLWVIIAAGGSGARMGANTPKQYLPLCGKTVIEHTLDCLLTYPRFNKIVVVLPKNDTHWASLNFPDKEKLLIATGDKERYHSVLNGLTALKNLAAADDWVLVHDAARPCLQHSDIDKLIAQLADHPVGGLLGAPLHNTIKQVAADHHIINTLDRSKLWQAFSPQMFRYGLLTEALHAALKQQQPVTDDASAIELLGKSPLMIEGRRDNIKITEPADLALAEFYLSLIKV